MVSLTIFDNIYDNKTNKRMDYNSFDEFEAVLYKLSESTKYPTKKDAPLISPAVYIPDTTRANDNVTAWGSFGILDIDDFDASNIQDPDRWDEYKEAVERSKINKETDMNLLTIAYQTDYVYYTEWEEEFYQYAEMSDGNVIELTEVDSGYD